MLKVVVVRSQGVMSVYYVFVCKYITPFHYPNWLDRSMGLQPYMVDPFEPLGWKNYMYTWGNSTFGWEVVRGSGRPVRGYA